MGPPRENDLHSQSLPAPVQARRGQAPKKVADEKVANCRRMNRSFISSAPRTEKKMEELQESSAAEALRVRTILRVRTREEAGSAEAADK